MESADLRIAAIREDVTSPSFGVPSGYDDTGVRMTQREMDGGGWKRTR
jgi:hypothetical protein